MVPDDYMGDVIADINKKRGRILGMEPFEKGQRIVGEVPQAELHNYANDLRSLTVLEVVLEVDLRDMKKCLVT